MLIGAMNNPASELMHEIRWITEMKLDFLDLTLEPPRAGSWSLSPRSVAAALEQSHLRVVGHTAYYLPIASPFEELRRAAIAECLRCLDFFADVGASWMNVHPDNRSPLHPKQYHLERNLDALGQIVAYARKLGRIGVMVENIPGDDFNSAADLGFLLDALPELGLHLDFGHCNLSSIPHNAATILEHHGGRLRHVHLHDNKGGREDLHLPLGVGTMDIPAVVRLMKACGYDGTVTLEVFSPDRAYLAHSRDKLREWWQQV
jgi:sugar phosphate isomerase/epimerase